jgi:outer membrane protein assembly factor BamE (lipoprotein component of BamABCDE complex)
MKQNQHLTIVFAVRAMVVAAGVLLTTSACVPKVETNGYVKNQDISSLVTVGKTTKDEVQSTLGSPSAQSSFGADSWYYINDRKEAYGFMKYDVVDQNVTRIEFDDKDVVAKVEGYDKSKSEDIELVKRETTTEGHTLGFFEQMLGNIGRFNAPGGNSGNVAGRRGPTGGR